MYAREGCCNVLIYRKLEKVKFLKNKHIKPKNRTRNFAFRTRKNFDISRAREYIVYEDRKRA